ncbi:hypothetical protein RvY_06146 [Ramazzottius varieornatus]|uniref:Uncharacterized protein n=1 Tax=Ramazzottius varieornatus TaxID=947166 RepID=A0A1D1V3Y4_RAMVA|nr:hypothetical protein RvY_06146 [Ramazzottius varieornatus]
MSTRRKATRAELEVFCGHLTFAGRAVHGARTFTRIFLDGMSPLKEDTHRLRISAVLRNELQWWSEIAPLFNGLCPYKFGSARRVYRISTDAFFSGFGATSCTGLWLTGSWISGQKPLDKDMWSNWVESPTMHDSFLAQVGVLHFTERCRDRHKQVYYVIEVEGIPHLLFGAQTPAVACLILNILPLHSLSLRQTGIFLHL